MNSELDTTTGGSLSKTSSPQNINQTSLGSGSTNLQSINADTILSNNTGSGVSLSPSNLSTVNVSKPSTSTSTIKNGVDTPAHHVCAGLIIIIVALVVVAAGLIYRNFNLDKNTTY
jgi:hypothetical protein